MNIGSILGGKMMESRRTMPEWAKVATITRPCPDVGGVRTGLHLGVQGFLNIALQEAGAKCLQRVLLDLPMRGISAYRHDFTAKGVDFGCLELSVGFGNASMVALANCVMERDMRSGCLNCGYGELIDEDESCSVCRNGFLRDFVVKHGHPCFRDHGWPALQRILDPDIVAIVDDLASFSFRFHTNKAYRVQLANDFQVPDEPWINEAIDACIMEHLVRPEEDEEDEEDGEDGEDGED